MPWLFAPDPGEPTDTPAEQRANGVPEAHPSSTGLAAGQYPICGLAASPPTARCRRPRPTGMDNAFGTLRGPVAARPPLPFLEAARDGRGGHTMAALP